MNSKDSQKQLVVITGMSGAGKTLAIRTFEDLNYFCIDNLPPDLLANLVNLWKESGVDADGLAIVVDVRTGQFFGDFMQAYEELTSAQVKGYSRAKILFLDASDPILIRRFKETRRKHPLVAEGKGILESIKEERHILADIKEKADKVIDTSNLEPEGFRREIRRYFGPQGAREGMVITVISFGYKYGVPLDADLVFDVRFLANPYWVEKLSKLDGNQEEVRHYVLSDPLTEPLMERLCSLIEFSIPQYEKEGKAYLSIAIGCTGGRHRSVVVANELARYLSVRDFNVLVEHRDCPKG
ncbi:MAG TPA: RNase adapter RapZ [Armatimonadota bacterium]|nr:RNase adapter RapZ [Armatimonadota bacterium]